MIACPLCTIPKREELLYSDDLVYLVSTNDMKGHSVRVMVCTHEHIDKPKTGTIVHAIAVLSNYMTNLMGDAIWHVVHDTYASIPEHWHRIGCDNYGEPDELEKLSKSPKISFNQKYHSTENIMIGIPAFNEEKNIADVIHSAKHFCPLGHIVIYDDGSTDDTAKIALNSGALVIAGITNEGYGSGLSTLFEHAKRRKVDVLITLDGDGQHDPIDIPLFLKALESSDVVIGNRFGLSKVPIHRKAFIYAMNRLVGVGDCQCGFRAYSRKALEEITITEKGMGASLEILEKVHTKGLKIKEVPTIIKYDDSTHSQSALSHGATLIQTLFWRTVWLRPFTTLGIPAICFFLLTVYFGAWMVYFYTRSQDFVLSYALISFSSGILAALLMLFAAFITVQRRMVEEINA